MCRGLKIGRGPKVHGVAHITHNTSIDRRHVAPFPACGLDLEPGHVLAPEQRQRAEVRMGACPMVVDLLVVLFVSGVVHHVAQVVVAWVVVAVSRGEEVLGELEDEGEELEDLLGYA